MAAVDSDDQRFVVQVLQELDQRNGAVSKRQFQAIFRDLRAAHGRVDLNYGSWVASDNSRVIRLVETGADDDNPLMALTDLGRKLLRDSGVVPVSVSLEEQEDNHMRQQFEHDTGESFDD